MNNSDVEKVLSTLVDLMASYSSIYRGSYLPSRVSQLKSKPGDKILRESVAEHVGLLPIAASFLHPYLENKVDLGKTLLMLSIHDIGEVVVGDVLTVRDKKTEQHISAERNAALSLLHQAHHQYFNELDEGSSNEARFAHSVDKITPNLYELIIDVDTARARHSYFGFDINLAVKKDMTIMRRDRFLEKFYNKLIEKVEVKFI